MKIAIIGMGFRFPGACRPQEFWNILQEGRDLVGLPNEHRAALFPKTHQPVPMEAGYLDQVDCFDAGFFNINGLEARVLDPQQRLLLECAWETLEEGGIQASQLAGTRTGVFVGAHTHDYLELCARAEIEVNAYWNAGMNASVMANRISHFFDFTGPSVTLNTACSSGLEAVHQAAIALETGQCVMALAGGVNLILTPSVTLSASRAGMLSPESRCKTFDAAANGFVRGEGVGFLALKPLDQAQEDGDPIYGVIRGTASCHGGRANSLTAPNLTRQRDLLRNAYDRAGIDTSSISYLETHGTGTRLGDSIEVEALKEVFCQNEAGPVLIGLGSVKTNIGHLESAAGIAGMVKVCLAMKYRMLPATVHFNKAGSLIDLQDTGLYIVKDTQPWTVPEGPLRAGVSAFGFGGSYAHVILEEAPPSQAYLSNSQSSFLITLSALNPNRLAARAMELADWLSDRNPSLESLAYVLQTGREPLSCRLAFIVEDKAQLRALLNQFHEKPGEGRDWYFARLKGQRGCCPKPFSSDPSAHYPLKNKDIRTLARLWVDGVNVDFQDLYTERPPHLSLPTYPFAPKKHWI